MRSVETPPQEVLAKIPWGYRQTPKEKSIVTKEAVMILYDIYDIGYYLDSKTLEPTTDLKVEEIVRISSDFSGIFYCRGYVVVFSRNRIELLTQDKRTEL